MYLKFFLSNFDRVSLSGEKNNFAYLCAFTPSLFNYKYRTLVGVEATGLTGKVQRVEKIIINSGFYCSGLYPIK